MDKMMVDDMGDITVTNDGATIVDEMNVEHPAAKMVVEVAKTQDDEVGDGTTTAVVITGELLHQAEGLLDQGIHSTIIANGYRMAAGKTQEILAEIGEKVTLADKDTLIKVAETAMTGKGAERAKQALAELSVKAVTQVAETEGSVVTVDLDNIQVEKKTGSSILDSELIAGVILDKEVAHAGMPREASNAKVALVNSALEIKKTETDAKIKITSASQLSSFNDQEEKILKGMVDAVAKSGATVLFCQKGVDDLALHYLSKAGILTAKSVKESDMKKLAKATGATVVSRVKEIKAKDLGKAASVAVRKVSGDEMIFVSGCKNPKAVSILVRGGTSHVLDEAERSVADALGGVAAAAEVGKVVAGGGAPEVELASRLRKFADGIGGREQLAVNAFADALEIIPRTLAESAGADAIDMLVALRAKHDKKGKSFGVDAIVGKVADMKALGVIEPLKIKTQAIKSASEATEMILRIDDMIASEKKDLGGPPGGGMPPM